MEHGKVTSVEYRDGVAYCSVRAMRSGSNDQSIEYDPMPVMKTHSGFIQVPKVGQQVTMEKLDDGTRFISNILGKEADFPDDMAQGDLAIQLDGGTEVRLSERKDGNYDLHLNASGDLFIDGINFDEHTHDYDWTDLGGSSTTEPPK